MHRLLTSYLVYFLKTTSLCAHLATAPQLTRPTGSYRALGSRVLSLTGLCFSHLLRTTSILQQSLKYGEDPGGRKEVLFQLTFGPSDEGEKGFCHPHCAPQVHLCHLLVGLHASELHLPKCRDARIVHEAPHAWTGGNRTMVTLWAWPLMTPPSGWSPFPSPLSCFSPQDLPASGLRFWGYFLESRRITGARDTHSAGCDPPLHLQCLILISLLTASILWAHHDPVLCVPSHRRPLTSLTPTLLHPASSPHPVPSHLFTPASEPPLALSLLPEARGTSGVFQAKTPLEHQEETQP